jgi:hypothetical protein
VAALVAALAALLAACGEDMDPAMVCAMECPVAGGTCDGEVCRIVADSDHVIACPDDIPCEVDCSQPAQACRDGVLCRGATRCTVICAGARACQAGVDCAASECAVTCDGDEACEGGIRGDGGTCTSHCCGVDACALGTGACVNDDRCS